MKIYQHCNTLILRKGDSINVIHHNVEYEFYEGTLILDTDEDIVNFCKHQNVLIYHTTKKRIIATSISVCQHQCFFNGEEQEIDEDTQMPNLTAVLKENVEKVIFGTDFLVYYDGFFHMICHGEFVKSAECDITCFIEEDLRFMSYVVYHVVVPFNIKRIVDVTVKHKQESNAEYKLDEVSMVKDFYNRMGPYQEYMLCDLGNGDHHVLAPIMYSQRPRGLECHYVYGDGLTTDNLFLSSLDKNNYNKCVTFIMTEGGPFYYNPRTQEKHLIHGTSFKTVSGTLKEAGLDTNVFPFVVYDGMAGEKSISVYVVDVPEDGFFERYDIHEGSNGIYLINTRGRLWKNSNGFTIMVNGSEVRVYTHHTITDLGSLPGSGSKIHVHQLYKCTRNIKAIYNLGMNFILLTEDEEIMYGITFKHYMTEDGIPKYLCQIGEIDFSRHENKIDEELIHYDSHEDDEQTDYAVDDGNYLDEMMRICRTLSHEYVINIKIVEEHEGDQVLIASDVKRSFIHKALLEFRDLYLEERGRWPVLKQSITRLEKKELWRLGATLNMMVDMMEGPLPIRLPLLIVEAIRNKPFTQDDFEYFTKEQNPVAYETLSQYKNHPNDFHELETSYATYEEALRSVCGWPMTSDLGEETVTAIREAANEIGIGFRKHRKVENMGRMNAPTLDYYLSGPYRIDKNILCTRIEVTLTECYHKLAIISKICGVIRGLKEPELTQLLINWSGTPVIQKVYKVEELKNANFNFKTCVCTVTIPSTYFSNLAGELKNLLVSPMEHMKD